MLASEVRWCERGVNDVLQWRRNTRIHLACREEGKKTGARDVSSCCTPEMPLRPFSFEDEPAKHCILDVPGLNVNGCFETDRFQKAVVEIKEKIAAWGQMDFPAAAADIARDLSAHDYHPRVNSYPQSSLAIFSPTLRRLCVLPRLL